MSTDPARGVCIVRATSEGHGVRFSVLGLLDVLQTEPVRRVECVHETEALEHVHRFLVEFKSCHEK